MPKANGGTPPLTARRRSRVSAARTDAGDENEPIAGLVRERDEHVVAEDNEADGGCRAAASRGVPRPLRRRMINPRLWPATWSR
jgi:hypothetical protein